MGWGGWKIRTETLNYTLPSTEVRVLRQGGSSEDESPTTSVIVGGPSIVKGHWITTEVRGNQLTVTPKVPLTNYLVPRSSEDPVG